MSTIIALLVLVSMIGLPISIVGFIIQLARKKPSKNKWGISTVCFSGLFVACTIFLGSSESENMETNNVAESAISTYSEIQSSIETEENDNTEENVTESAQTSDHEQHEETDAEKKTQSEESKKSDAERFADENNVSVKLAESLESALEGMELTDKSRVGVFHYDLSDVYDWSPEENWANGKRYSAWMDMEHVWYIYVTDDTVVGIRDGSGNIYYSAE